LINDAAVCAVDQCQSCPGLIDASITLLVHGITNESTRVGPIEVEAAAIVLAKLISIVRNKLIDALANPGGGELTQLAEPPQRSGIQVHADVTHGITAVERVVFRYVHDAAGVRGTFAASEEEGLCHLGLEGGEAQLGRLILIHGKVHTSVAKIANSIEQHDGPLVVGEDVFGHLSPIPINLGVEVT